MEIGDLRSVEFVLTCYVCTLCMCLMGLWMYELVRMRFTSSKHTNKQWKACPYCGSIIISQRTPIGSSRCPTCQLYQD